MLECHLNMNFDTINEIHVTMSELYRYSDRFTALLSFPNPKDRNREVILAHIDSFYDCFIEMFEYALENENMTLEENARIELNNFLSTCKIHQVDFRELSLKSKNSDTIDSIVSADSFCATGNVLNLTYAYFTFQTILFNKKSVNFEQAYCPKKNHKKFDIHHYNLDFKSPLRSQGCKEVEKIKLHYDDFDNGLAILKGHFKYNRSMIKYVLAEERADASSNAKLAVDELCKMHSLDDLICFFSSNVLQLELLEKRNLLEESTC